MKPTDRAGFDVVMLTTGHSADDSRIFHREAKTLVQTGFTVCIISPGGQEGSNEGVYLAPLPQPHSRFERLLLGRKLLKKALALDGKIFIFHDPELFGVALIMTLLGRRLVYDCHENLPMQVLKKTWIPVLLQWVLVPLLWLFEWMASRMIAGVIVARDKVASRFPRKRTVLVRNFPTRSALEVLGRGIPVENRSNIVIYTGGLSRARGIAELVDAFREPQAPNAELWLVGNFEETDLKNEVLGGLSPRVKYFGRKDHAEVLELYQSAKVGVVTLHPLPSHRYSLPVKLFEYMGAGLPVIASNFPELAPIIEGCGIQVNPLDSREIKAAIEKLLCNGTDIAAMSKLARHRIVTELSWEAEGARLASFCSTLIATS